MIDGAGYGLHRPGRSACECQAFNLHNNRECPSFMGMMTDGWFLCARCRRHRKSHEKAVG